MADIGLPLTKSGTPYFPPPPQIPFAPQLSDLLPDPNRQGIAGAAAEMVAPFTYDALTYEPPPNFTANAAGKVPSAPSLGTAAAIDAAMLLLGGPEGRAAEVGLGAAERAAAKIDEGLLTGTYGELKGTLPPGYQANHINQYAAFKKILSRNDGFSVGMRGDIITEPGTPHYKFHRSLEEFWDQFRDDGSRREEMPTIAEYHQATQKALVASGFTPEQASYLVEKAANDFTSKGISLSEQVPEIPIAIWRKGKK